MEETKKETKTEIFMFKGICQICRGDIYAPEDEMYDKPLHKEKCKDGGR